MSSEEKTPLAVKIFGILLMVVLGCFLLFICSGAVAWIYNESVTPITAFKEERVNNIARVFMHNPGQYSILILQDDKSLRLLELTALVPDTTYQVRVYNEIQIVMDAPKGEPAFADITYYGKKYSEKPTHTSTKTVLHIHSPDDVEGGGWFNKVGKHTYSGQTNVIE